VSTFSGEDHAFRFAQDSAFRFAQDSAFRFAYASLLSGPRWGVQPKGPYNSHYTINEHCIMASAGQQNSGVASLRWVVDTPLERCYDSV
jgi:hypothetical protein